MRRGFGALALCIVQLTACGARAPEASHLGQIIDQDDLEAIEAAAGTPVYEVLCQARPARASHHFY